MSDQWYDNGEPETTRDHDKHDSYDPDCRVCAAEAEAEDRRIIDKYDYDEDDADGTYTQDDQGNWHVVHGVITLPPVPVWVAAWTDPDASDEDDSYALVGVFADGGQARDACEGDWFDSAGDMDDFEWADDLHGVGNGHYHYIIWPATIGERIKPSD